MCVHAAGEPLWLTCLRPLNYMWPVSMTPKMLSRPDAGVRSAI